MNSIFSYVVGLLQAALSLIGFVQQHPELPPVQKEQAQVVTQQAIMQATKAIPSCNISTSAARAGEYVTVTWSSQNIFDPVLYDYGALGGKYTVPVSGSRQIFLPLHSVSDTFALGDGGLNGVDHPICSIKVTVNGQTTTIDAASLSSNTTAITGTATNANTVAVHIVVEAGAKYTGYATVYGKGNVPVVN